jgi:tRNA-splicing ligase RtcB (3'-phosphate/5'-hydroxy nucleic acid ligase)
MDAPRHSSEEHISEVRLLLHTGSRGLGHQVCTDYVRTMDEALGRHGIVLPDRQLACAPFSSPEGRASWASSSVLGSHGR